MGTAASEIPNPRRARETDTSSTPWAYSFGSLDQGSLNLLGALSYLEPGCITQDVFERGNERRFPSDLEFCSDESSFSVALNKLLELGLVEQDRDSGNLSVQRSVQDQLKKFLSLENRQRHFHNAVRLLFDVFPREDVSQSQLYTHWELCNRYTQHVLNVKDCFVNESRVSETFLPSWEFCNLLSSYERFLSETNSMTELEALSAVNLEALKRLPSNEIWVTFQRSDLEAAILSHQAQAAEALGRPLKAIELNKQCYDIRKLQQEPPNNELLCFAANNLGYCHNTANLHEDAEKWYETSEAHWDTAVKNGEKSEDRPARHIQNHARCLVYLGKYDLAKEMFDISIPRLKSEKPTNWAMLAYALFAQAIMNRRLKQFKVAEEIFTEAHNVWIEGDKMRAHPFYAACLYKIGACCLDRGNVEAAIMRLRESLEIMKEQKEDRPVERARSIFKLSEALVRNNMGGSHVEATTLREDAESILRKANPPITKFDTESAYDDLVPIFWR
ncbi:hypothetical protein F5Y10DRAFT_291348 [Nemania abortiva]|nr:hypothetical protein F5Y10DRAFT_291348 [Nemania abortiva]